MYCLMENKERKEERPFVGKMSSLKTTSLQCWESVGCLSEVPRAALWVRETGGASVRGQKPFSTGFWAERGRDCGGRGPACRFIALTEQAFTSVP